MSEQSNIVVISAVVALPPVTNTTATKADSSTGGTQTPLVTTVDKSVTTNKLIPNNKNIKKRRIASVKTSVVTPVGLDKKKIK